MAGQPSPDNVKVRSAAKAAVKTPKRSGPAGSGDGDCAASWSDAARAMAAELMRTRAVEDGFKTWVVYGAGGVLHPIACQGAAGGAGPGAEAGDLPAGGASGPGVGGRSRRRRRWRFAGVP